MHNEADDKMSSRIKVGVELDSIRDSILSCPLSRLRPLIFSLRSFYFWIDLEISSILRSSMLSLPSVVGKNIFLSTFFKHTCIFLICMLFYFEVSTIMSWYTVTFIINTCFIHVYFINIYKSCHASRLY